MADAPIIHIGENSPEQVAYKLMRDIAGEEGKTFSHGSVKGTADRKFILDTYSECLRRVRSHAAGPAS